MSEIRVEFNRPLTCKKLVRGVEIEQATGLCYVDCFFPDGSQATYGYIGTDPAPGSVFAPLAHCKQDIANLIQAEIDRALGADGTTPPQIMEYPDDEDDNEDE